MAGLTREHINKLYYIIRRNGYSNADCIYFQCHRHGISIKRENVESYALRLKREDVIHARKSAMKRQHKIKILLARLRDKEQALLSELNSINYKLNKGTRLQL